MSRKLTRSADKKVAGVCGGLGEYFDINPTIIRIVFAILTIFSMGILGIVLYIVLILIMPRHDSGDGYQR